MRGTCFRAKSMFTLCSIWAILPRTRGSSTFLHTKFQHLELLITLGPLGHRGVLHYIFNHEFGLQQGTIYTQQYRTPGGWFTHMARNIIRWRGTFRRMQGGCLVGAHIRNHLFTHGHISVMVLNRNRKIRVWNRCWMAGGWSNMVVQYRSQKPSGMSNTQEEYFINKSAFYSLHSSIYNLNRIE